MSTALDTARLVPSRGRTTGLTPLPALLLLACAQRCPAADGADRSDSSDSSAPAAYCTEDDYAAMDDYTPSPWDELWHPRGCSWAYVASAGAAVDDGAVAVLVLHLPPADQAARERASYTLSIGADAYFAYGEASGARDELEFWDCNDVVQYLTGTVYVAESGTIAADLRYVCDTEPNECTGSDANPHYLLTASILDVSLVSGGGERLDYDTLGPLHAVVGQNNCGG